MARMDLVLLLLVIAAGLPHGESIECQGSTRKGILNYDKTGLFKLESDVENIEDVLKGSGTSVTQSGSLSLLLQAKGRHETDSGMVQKGFFPKTVCFTSKCVHQVRSDYEFIIPDYRFNQESNLWSPYPNGLSSYFSVVPLSNPDDDRGHCIDLPEPPQFTQAVKSVKFTFSQRALRGDPCTAGRLDMDLKGFYMRSCIEK